MFSTMTRNWSLRRHTFLVTVATFILLGLAVCEFARQTAERNYFKNFEQNSEILTTTMAAASHYDILSQNNDAINDTVMRLVDTLPDVKAVAIYNNKDIELAAWRKYLINNEKHKQSVSSYEKIIKNNGKPIGRIAVAFDVTKRKQTLRTNAINIYLIGIATVALCAALILAMLNRIVVNPVRRIHEHLLKLQNNENPEELKIAANKELYYLGNTVSELGNILELKKQNEHELEIILKEKSDFLANMSHELRTPINGVLGMLTLLRETPLDPQQYEQVRIASSSSKSLLTLINDILDYSKLEAGKLVYEQIEFDLENLVDECAEALSESAFSKSLTFLCQLAPNLPVNVIGDPTRLRQVITNLTGNAIKFTEKGSVKIYVEQLSDAMGCDKIKFTISDTGIGINAHTLNNLFKSFAQADSSTTRKFGGTGLGLAISRGIVEGMDGKIGVESIENQGSNFWFILDLPKSDKQTVLESNQIPLAENTKILLVEDVKPATKYLTQLLLEHKIDVDHANCGQEALHKIDEQLRSANQYDAVLFSTRLIDMSGREFTKHISDQENLQELKLIAINIISQARSNLYTHTNERISGHISKPAKRTEMAKALATALLKEGLYPTTQTLGNTLHTTAGDMENEPTSIAHIPENVASKRDAHRLSNQSNYSDITILITDDNLINQQVAQGMLEHLGFRTVLANHGKEALELLNQEPIDLILMDCQMPVLDGFETTQQIRASKAFCHLPIVALTANASQSDADKCFAAGMDDFLTKPIDVTKFEQTLIKALNYQRLEEDNEETHGQDDNKHAA